MPETAEPPRAIPCSACGTEVAPRLLTCPNCHRLVHGEQLKQLAASAELATRDGDTTAALSAWRAALDLLPPQSRQYEIISAKITDLGKQLDAAPRQPSAGKTTHAAHHPNWAGAGGIVGLGGLALLLWKFKFIAVFLLTKAKFLLLGLTKSSTFFSMFLSVGVYWTAFGWKLALGLVLSIYVHEMGHVAALVRYGIPASAPLFVPGLGAMIRLRQNLHDPHQDARVGLAGPLWGLGAALASAALFLATKEPIWAAIAQLGAWLNLFNMLPIWQLDGGRAFHAFTRSQRWLAAIAIAIAWVGVSSVNPQGEAVGMLLILGAVAAFQAWFARPAQEPDHPMLAHYITLIAALSALTLIPVPLRR
jgi:Zn-dependent protease